MQQRLYNDYLIKQTIQWNYISGTRLCPRSHGTSASHHAEHPIGGWPHLFTLKEQVEASRQGPQSCVAGKIMIGGDMSRMTTEK